MQLLHATVARLKTRPAHLAFPNPMDPTKSFWPIRRLKRFTTPCRTSFTSHGQSKLRKPARTSYARSRWSLTVAEARKLLAVRDRIGVKIGEAFMVRTHPQWLRARQLVASGRIGLQLRSALGFFSCFNNDPSNIRNIPEYGGGALMDIGCYPITTSRFMFGEEPSRVLGLVERDPQMQVDRLTSAILDFPSGQSTFTCSTQKTRALPAESLPGNAGPYRNRNPVVTLPMTGRAVSLSMTGVTCSVAALQPKTSPSATSTRFKATSSLEQFAETLTCRFRLRMHSRTWR